MTPALVVHRQRSVWRESDQGSEHFAPVYGIIAATLLSLLLLCQCLLTEFLSF